MSDQAPEFQGDSPVYRGTPPPPIYNFSAHAIGASAQFNKLDAERLKSVIQVPTLGASVLPSIGGVSRSQVSNFCHDTHYPRKRSLLSFHRITTQVSGLVVYDSNGQANNDRYETVSEADVESITFVEKFHIESAKYHLLSVRTGLKGDPVVSTTNRVEGIHLGRATIQVEFDDYLLPSFATAKKIRGNGGLPGADKKKAEKDTSDEDEAYAETYRFHIVKSLQIKQGQEKNQIQRFGPNGVHWDDFGFIFFGEVIVKGDDRQVTLVRLQMGSDAGGSGTVGDGHSNGSTGSN